MPRPFAAARLLALAALPALAAAAALPAAATERVALAGHVLPVLGDADVRPAAKRLDAFPITLTVVLRRSDEHGFQRDLAALYDPRSPSHRQWLTPAEIADRYGPSAADVDAVADHFAAEGLEVVERAPNRMLVTVRGARTTVERALGIAIGDFRKDGRTFRASLDEPRLPATIAPRVQAILGIDDFAQAQPSSLPLEVNLKNLKSCATSSSLESGAAASLLCGIVYFFGAILYNIGCLSHLTIGCTMMSPNPSADPRPAFGGAGQKVGIVAFDNFATADVRDFLALAGVPATRIAQLSSVAVNGGAPIGAGEHEVLLDINTVLMHAPQAQVVVYSAPNGGGGSYQALFNRMLTDGVTVISNSWAYCENQTTHADVASIDAILATAAAAGVSAFSASGDTGSTCLNGSANTVAVPAGVPHVTAVGGSSVVMGPGATHAGETWWDVTGPTPTGQGGYGTSRFFPRPAYQNGFTASVMRSVPDLVINADPAAAGVVICQASRGGCPNGLLYGGTSFSAPQMAAFTARLNHARGANLGFVNPQFYALAATPAFHSPASLGSDFAHVGIGAPNFSFLHLGLKGAVPGAPAPGVSIVLPLPSTVPADNAASAQVLVQVRDANGSAVAGRSIALAAAPAGGVTVTPVTAVSNTANGVAAFSVRSSAVQQVTLTATDVASAAVLGSAQVAFVVPPATGGLLQAFPTTVANNGLATTTLTVTLQDARGLPTPGKTVRLTQGPGRSIITAPVPPVSDAAGQIVFTATNRSDEAVTYAAVDATDGDLAIPGTPTVTFTGSAPTSCVPATAPVAAPGFALTPFVTGFFAEAFSYSNVNFGCAGGNNPAFRPDGEVLVGSFRSGALYRLPATGGAVTSGDAIATHGPTLGALVYGKDGRLYGARAATGAGFFSGAIHEFDPQTGAILRTLASGLACASPLAVDPVSGDLFYTGTCFGAGSDDPRLYRVVNPASASPAIVTYATLPGTPNGAVSFAPDGTVYVAVQYLLASPPVVRVSATNQAQPPTVTPIPGLASIFWVTVAETLPGGAAKSLIVLGTDNKVKLADISGPAPVLTDLITTGMSSGVVGPDGCVYTSNNETVFRLTQANGACGFTPTNPVPGITLTPAVTQPDPPQGSSVAITARLVGVPPAAGVPVIFRVRGANEQLRLVRTDAAGRAVLALAGALAGDDAITAQADTGSAVLVSNTARIRWSAGQHPAFVTLNAATTSAIAGVPVQLTATLVDPSLAPNVPIAGVTLQFSVGGQSCSAVTGANGVATCSVTLPLTGTYALTVSFAGNGAYTASLASTPFVVTSAPPGPCSVFNDVAANDPFCQNIAWIRNRGVTLGCLPLLYCPVDDVVRTQMAAFMNRLGTALAGSVLFTTAATGPLDLDAAPVVCQSADFPTGSYTRRATIDAVFSASAAGATAFAADAVASFDAGATWVALATFGNRGFAATGHWGHVRAAGRAELEVAQSVRFGVQVTRGAQPGSADPVDGRCALRAVIVSR